MDKFIETFGALPFIEDVRDYRLKKITKAEDFPAEFTLDKVAVKSQGSVGSCVAHSVAEIIEYHNQKQEKNTLLMSTGFIYGNRRNSSSKTSGMYIREALSNACKYGDVYKADFNENKEVPEAIELFEQRFDALKDKAYPNRFSTYFRLTSDDEIKRALMSYGPVIFAVDWRADAKVDSDGVLHLDSKKEKTGGHCMIIYG